MKPLAKARGSSLKAEGFAKPPYFYCVWTENKTQEEIISDELHEATHILVHNELNHYCLKPYGLTMDDINQTKEADINERG